MAVFLLTETSLYVAFRPDIRLSGDIRPVGRIRSYVGPRRSEGIRASPRNRVTLLVLAFFAEPWKLHRILLQLSGGARSSRAVFQ